MKYKTKGNASPQGRPRVYFTGHPADVKQHFESITDAILDLHNCAVFYDVEVNYEFAVRLITRSAEAGLPEAMEKLVSMYRTGEGVERDHRAAIRWQEKLGNISQAQGDPAGARPFYEKVLAIREQLASEVGTTEAYDDLAISCYKMFLAVVRKYIE